MKAEHFVTVCRQLVDSPEATQRKLAAGGKLSLGLVNGTLKECLSAGYLRQEGRKLLLTEAGQAYLEQFRVKNAIILAAGFGSRCVPLTYETPKGLLKVHGQPMIERQIEQLLEKGITEIIVVVGYKKEYFEYLIDQYGVRLVYNPEYAAKNNLGSLYCVLSELDSSYLLMSDHWIKENIFNTYEARSWCASFYAEGPTGECCVTVSPSDRILTLTIGGCNSLAVLGPAYFSSSFSVQFKKTVAKCYARPGTGDYFWEQALSEALDSLPIYLNPQPGVVYEFDNLDELRMFDPSYNIASNSRILESIARIYRVPEEKIQNVQPIKTGMTNSSFSFTIDGEAYLYRMPGPGADQLIDRKNEYAVYQAVSPLGICDEVIYIDPETGDKITRFIKGARVCDPQNSEDVKQCMKKLRAFHEKKIRVPHAFDAFAQICFFEKRWVAPSCFRDYEDTKKNIMLLKEYLDSVQKDCVLSHIDAVPDNFLFVTIDGKEEIRLIDWEYAGMQDPHIDIAMFAIYAFYDRGQIDALIDCYFEGACPKSMRLKIYAYVAVCGLLWSNWCEYKRQMGVEFGEYALRQYRFAKDYYRIFMEMRKKNE